MESLSKLILHSPELPFSISKSMAVIEPEEILVGYQDHSGSCPKLQELHQHLLGFTSSWHYFGLSSLASLMNNLLYFAVNSACLIAARTGSIEDINEEDHTIRYTGNTISNGKGRDKHTMEGDLPSNFRPAYLTRDAVGLTSSSPQISPSCHSQL